MVCDNVLNDSFLVFFFSFFFWFSIIIIIIIIILFHFFSCCFDDWNLREQKNAIEVAWVIFELEKIVAGGSPKNKNNTHVQYLDIVCIMFFFRYLFCRMLNNFWMSIDVYWSVCSETGRHKVLSVLISLSNGEWTEKLSCWMIYWKIGTVR